MKSDLLEDLLGRRIPGGCDDCDAYQTVLWKDGFYVLRIFHDGTCPFWRQINDAVAS